MSIVKMKRLRLFGMRSDREALFRELQHLGCVEIDEPQVDGEDALWASLSRPDDRALNQAREESALMLSSLEILKEYAPEKGGLAGLLKARPVVSEQELFDDAAYAAALETARGLVSVGQKITSLYAEESKLRSQKLTLVPWLDLDLPLETASTREVRIQLGTIPVKTPMEEVLAALSTATELCQLTLVSEDTAAHYVLLICHQQAAESVDNVLKEYGFSPANLRGWTGTARENDRRLEEQIAGLDRELEEAKAEIAAQKDRRGVLERCADRAAQEIRREEAKAHLLDTTCTFYLQGWIPAESEERLAGILSKYTCALETEVPAPEDYEEVPVQLKNNKLTRPYNVITEMYSLPAYNGLDPNPFIMPSFALFFGIMFADMAYGLLMVLIGAVALKKMRPKGTMKNMMCLLIQCGISACIVGFLTGGFFGDAVSVVGGIFGQEWSLVPYLGTIHIGEIAIDLPLDLLEGNNPLYVLIMAMGIGIVHLAVGVGIGTYLNIKDGKWLDAIADLSWWVILAGIGVMVVTGSNVVLIVGVVIMAATAFLQGKGIGRFTNIFSAVYNGVTGYLGDILSYSRLMALMLAGSVIGSVFNQLGSLGGLVLFIPVALIGHTLNFALNLIGCFVHTMRLHFLEFFGKWYRDGGRPFRPLNYNTKYVDIKEE